MSRILSSLLLLALLLTAVVPASGVISSQLQNPTWETEIIDCNDALHLRDGLNLGRGELATKAARVAALKNKAEIVVDAAETVVDVGTAVATGDTTAIVEMVTDQVRDRAMSGKKKAGNSPGPKSPKQSNAEADAAAKKPPHGNTLDDRPATLYEKYDKDGNFQKHGITKHEDPTKRYTKKQIDGGEVRPVERGPRSEMAKKERDRVETNPGPDNKEPWAGKRAGESDE